GDGFERGILEIEARALQPAEEVVVHDAAILLIEHAHVRRAERRDRARTAQLAFAAAEQPALAEPVTVALEALHLVELRVAHPDAPERIAGDPRRFHHLAARVALRGNLAARHQAERQRRRIADRARAALGA